MFDIFGSDILVLLLLSKDLRPGPLTTSDSRTLIFPSGNSSKTFTIDPADDGRKKKI